MNNITNIKDQLTEASKSKIPSTMKVGTSFVNPEGMIIEITDIEITETHKSKPRVIVTYNYKNTRKDAKNGYSGKEDNYLEYFVKEIIRGK